MKQAVMKKWVKALRSGKYKQAKGALEKEGKYCCLGVLCKLAEKEHRKVTYLEWDGKTKLFGPDLDVQLNVLRWSGLKFPNGQFLSKKGNTQLLTSLNDEGKRFKTIADIIEKNWRKL